MGIAPTFSSFGMESTNAVKIWFRPLANRSSRKSHAIRKSRIADITDPLPTFDRKVTPSPKSVEMTQVKSKTF